MSEGDESACFTMSVHTFRTRAGGRDWRKASDNRFKAECTLKAPSCLHKHWRYVNLARAPRLATCRGTMIDDLRPALVLLPVLASERPYARLHRVAGVVLAPVPGTLPTSDWAHRAHTGLRAPIAELGACPPVRRPVDGDVLLAAILLASGLKRGRGRGRRRRRRCRRGTTGAQAASYRASLAHAGLRAPIAELEARPSVHGPSQWEILLSAVLRATTRRGRRGRRHGRWRGAVSWPRAHTTCCGALRTDLLTVLLVVAHVCEGWACARRGTTRVRQAGDLRTVWTPPPCTLR